MKKIHVLTILTIALSLNTLAQRLENINFVSFRLIEYQWNTSTKTYVATNDEPLVTFFKFRNDSVIFKKGNQRWLANGIEYSSNEIKDGFEYSVHHDERRQMIKYNKNNDDINYYHEWNDSLSIHTKLAKYIDVRPCNEEFSDCLVRFKDVISPYKKGNKKKYTVWEIDFEEFNKMDYYTVIDTKNYLPLNKVTARFHIEYEENMLNGKKHYVSIFLNKKLEYKHFIQNWDVINEENKSYEIYSGGNRVILLGEAKAIIILLNFKTEDETFEKTLLLKE